MSAKTDNDNQLPKKSLVSGLREKLDIKSQEKNEHDHHKVKSILEWLRNVNPPPEFESTHGIITDEQYGDLTDEDEWRTLPSSCYGLAILSMITDVGFCNYIVEEGEASCCGRKGGGEKGGRFHAYLDKIRKRSSDNAVHSFNEDVSEEQLHDRLSEIDKNRTKPQPTTEMSRFHNHHSAFVGFEAQLQHVEGGEGGNGKEEGTQTQGDNANAKINSSNTQHEDEDEEIFENSFCNQISKAGLDSAATSAVLIVFLILYLIGCGVPLIVILCVGVSSCLMFLLFLDYYSFSSPKMATAYAQSLTNFIIPCFFAFLVQFFLIIELWKSLPLYSETNFCGNSSMSQLCIIGVFYSAVCPTLSEIFVEFLVITSSRRAIFRKEIKGKDTLFVVDLPYDWTLRLRLLILVLMEFLVFLGVLVAGTKYVLTSDGCGNLIQAGLATVFINEIDNMFFEAFILGKPTEHIA